MEFFRFINFIFVFQEINSFLIISMIINKVDNCIRKIELEDGTNLFEKNTRGCAVSENYLYNEPLIDPIPYEIGQKIKIVIGDSGESCFFKMDIFINNNSLKNDDIKFWDCDNCFNYGFNYSNKMLNCYPPFTRSTPNNYSIYFKINSLEDIDFNTSEYFYYLNNRNDIYISSPDFNNAINLIDLHSVLFFISGFIS